MDLKALLGDKYHDDMTVEEINATLAEKNLVDPATLPKSVNKDVFDKTASELASLKKQLKEKMTAEETAAAAQKEFQEQMAALQKENSLFKFKEQFLSGGYDAKTAVELAEAIAEGDMTKFTATHAKFVEQKTKDLQAQIKADLLKNTPGLGGNPDDGGEGESLGAKAAAEWNSQFTVPESN